MTSTANVNATQFEGYTGGPAEAKERAYPSPPSSSQEFTLEGGWKDKPPEPKQGQLFSPESIPLPEAHTQTPDQFAKDPRTWWHGRVTKGGPQGRLGGSGVGRGEGFHAGTYGAAEQRVKTNVSRRGLQPGMAGRMYPLRITGSVDPPEEDRPDMNIHRELGPHRYGSWGGSATGGRKTGYLYKNEIEGGGAMSVGVPQRKGFMSTQREMVGQAQKEGKYVHPNIAWAVKHPEHTAESIGDRYRTATPKWQRYAQSHLSYDTAKASDQEKMDRTSYQTESGRTKHVWRYRDPAPGSALLSKQQWMPAS